MSPNERLGDEIDASLFEDDDGAMYFVWHCGKLRKLEPDFTGAAEPIRAGAARLHRESGRGAQLDPARLGKQRAEPPRGVARLGPDESLPSNEASLESVPSAPDGLVATVVHSRRVDLSWTDRSAGEDGFEFERVDEGGEVLRVGPAGPEASSATAARVKASKYIALVYHAHLDYQKEIE